MSPPTKKKENTKKKKTTQKHMTIKKLKQDKAVFGNELRELGLQECKSVPVFILFS